MTLLLFAFVMVTSFVKIVVVLSILRSALGTPQVPPAMVITGLAIILTTYVMTPTGIQIADATQPLWTQNDGKKHQAAILSEPKLLINAIQLAKDPLREFLLAQSEKHDRLMFRDLTRRIHPATAAQEKDMRVV